jgi:hypothetical protein
MLYFQKFLKQQSCSTELPHNQQCKALRKRSSMLKKNKLASLEVEAQKKLRKCLVKSDARNALVISDDPILQEHFVKRLTKHFNFDLVDVANNKDELLSKIKKDFLWIIVSEDFPDMGLNAIAKFFGCPSQKLLILIGEMDSIIAEKVGFDVVLKPSQLGWGEY